MKDELIKSLLAHDVDEPVPPEHERKIRAGLGALLGDPSPVGDPSPEAPDAPSPPPGAGAAATKLTGVIALGAALAGGVAGFAIGRASGPDATPTVTTTPSATNSASPIASTSSSAVAIAADPTTDVPAPLPSATERTTAVAPTRSGGSAPATASNDAFDLERSLLDRARAALVRHDPAAAARALDESERDFPRSQHVEERDYLRIQIARERGETDRVKTLAKAFLAKYPQSLYRARVEPLAQ